MKKILLFIFFLLLVLFPQYTSANNSKVAVIGSSSFKAGCSSNGFVIQLKKTYTNKEFICFAENSKATDYFLQQFNDNVKNKKFNELIIYAGLNGLSNLKLSQENLTKIFQAAEAEKITVIVISAQPFKDNTYNTWTKPWGDNLIKNHEWLATKPEGIDYFVDIYSIVKDSSDPYKLSSTYASRDFLHMNQKGQDLIFQKISEIYNTGSISNTNSSVNNSTNAPQSRTLTADELKNMVSRPSLQIRIPGLNIIDGIKIVERDGSTYLQSTIFQQYLVAVYKYSVVAISILAVIMIIVAGIQWLISGGSPEKINTAKKRIGGAIIGIILIIGSYTILNSVNPYLVNFNSLETIYFSKLMIDKGQISEKYTGRIYNSNAFDKLFQLYEPCLEVDWNVLKALAYVESSLKPDAKSDTGYAGLFQTKEKNCRDTYLKPYSDTIKNRCSDVNDPETSTMVGVSSLIQSKKIIEKECLNANFESKLFFMYTCHHSGNSGCTKVMKDTNCDHTKAKEIIYKMWLDHSFKDKVYGEQVKLDKKKGQEGKYNAERHANDGFNTGMKFIETVRQYNGNLSYIKENQQNCPLTNENLIGTAQIEQPANPGVSPDTNITCDPSYNKRKILVVGDSLTQNKQSYANQLKSSCPNLDITIKACGGLNLNYLWHGYTNSNNETGVGCNSFEGLKDQDLTNFDDLILLAGINGITQDVNTTKKELENFYKKPLKNEGRIIAITITPSYDYKWSNKDNVIKNTEDINNWMKNNNDINLVIDAYAILDKDNDGKLDSTYGKNTDGLHFNTLGHTTIAAELAKKAYSTPLSSN